MLGGRRIGIAVVLACGCGPTVAGSDGSHSGSHGSESGGDEAGHDTSSASAATSIDTSAGDTGPVVDDTCVHGDPDACPEGCYRDEAWQVIDDACTTSSVALCLPGGPKPLLPVTTYWALASSGPVFIEYGSGCSSASQPTSWRACMGAADEPADCACFCQAGYCRGDADRRALDECGLTSACDAVFVDAQLGAANHDAEQCVLTALRDRLPGIYEVTVANGMTVDTTRYYAFGDEVARIAKHTSDVFECPSVSEWGSASRCTLAPADFFATCLAPSQPGDECVLHLDAWLLDCVEQPPSCP